MRMTTVFRGVAVTLALLVSTDAAQAWSMAFWGTMEEVRAGCMAEGATLEYDEYYGYASCVNPDQSWIYCENNGHCGRGGPRYISGGRGFGARNYQPPQSLVESGGSSGETGGASDAPSAPAPNAPTPPIFN